jgi:hypothetical protein
MPADLAAEHRAVPAVRALSGKITDLLSGGTSTIRDGLAPLHQALMAVERPATVWHWLELPRVRSLLAALGHDHRPLTHEILDGLPEGDTLEHLRSVLVAAGALTARDERLVRLERWMTQAIAARDAADERRILHRYAVWHLLRRLRQRRGKAAARPERALGALLLTTKEQVGYVRRHVLAAVGIFDLMCDQDLTLATLTQADLDRWSAERRFTYPQQTAHFVRWVVASKHARGLKPPGSRPACRNGPTTPNDAGPMPGGCCTMRAWSCLTGWPGCSCCSTPKAPSTSPAWQQRTSTGPR